MDMCRYVGLGCLILMFFFYLASERELTIPSLWSSAIDTVRMVFLVLGIQHLCHCLGV